MARRRSKNQALNVPGLASIATTSTTDSYLQAGKAGKVTHISFGSLAALAASDTNYITWTITNLGQAGAGTTEMLAATDVNTTKATGGTALVASSHRALTLTATVASLAFSEGDTIRFRATATGTLAGAVTIPRYTFSYDGTGAA